jgi:hypothetical protein
MVILFVVPYLTLPFYPNYTHNERSIIDPETKRFCDDACDLGLLQYKLALVEYKKKVGEVKVSKKKVAPQVVPSESTKTKSSTNVPDPVSSLSQSDILQMLCTPISEFTSNHKLDIHADADGDTTDEEDQLDDDVIVIFTKHLQSHASPHEKSQLDIEDDEIMQMWKSSPQEVVKLKSDCFASMNRNYQHAAINYMSISERHPMPSQMCTFIAKSA